MPDFVESLTKLRDAADQSGESMLAYLIDMALTEAAEVQRDRGEPSTSTSINPPKRQDRYPDRDIDCQQAIEDALTEMRLNIQAAGWTPVEIAEAIDSLTMADRRARKETGAMDAFLLMQRIGKKE